MYNQVVPKASPRSGKQRIPPRARPRPLTEAEEDAVDNAVIDRRLRTNKRIPFEQVVKRCGLKLVGGRVVEA